MKKLISHNQGMFASVILTAILLVWTYGCESQVKSLVTDDMVTRDELTAELNAESARIELELDNLQERAALKFTKLDRQDEIKAKLFEAVSVATTTGSFNPAGLIALVGSVLGLGAIVDNRIKDKVIKNRPLLKTLANTN